MKSVLIATVVGFAVIVLQSCSPDTSSQNARQGFNSGIKPNVVAIPENSPETPPRSSCYN
ncbi:MAG: hypothetical protein Q9O24_03100 [Gammaproteobacteria bacterium]|nr:hypothetical protein [Gammaproteobacteria bacterium]